MLCNFNTYSFSALKPQNNIINSKPKSAQSFKGLYYSTPYQKPTFDNQINYLGLNDYRGPSREEDGISLDPGPYARDIGLFRSGGYVVTDMDTPVSTVGMYGCAALYIPNEKKNEHFLWHVGENTSEEKILNNLEYNNIPCDKVWIARGCDGKTYQTCSRIINAVKSINPDVKIGIVEPYQDQEVIGYKGELFGSTDRFSLITFKTPRTNNCG